MAHLGQHRVIRYSDAEGLRFLLHQLLVDEILQDLLRQAQAAHHFGGILLAQRLAVIFHALVQLLLKFLRRNGGAVDAGQLLVAQIHAEHIANAPENEHQRQQAQQ